MADRTQEARERAEAYQPHEWCEGFKTQRCGDECICDDIRTIARSADRVSPLETALRNLFQEAGVELNDPRLGYVVVQIRRANWELLRALAEGDNRP